MIAFATKGLEEISLALSKPNNPGMPPGSQSVLPSKESKEGHQTDDCP